MLAEKFKAKRKAMKLSQQALAAGICEQSQISKIERGNYMPAADLLYRLAERLEVSLDYFFNDQVEITSNLGGFKSLVGKLLDDRNYQDLAYLYELEIAKKKSLTTDDEAYLVWLDALLDYYLHEKQSQSLKKLEDLLKNLHQQSSTYLRILNTLANFYADSDRHEDYEHIYTQLLEVYKNKDLTYQEDLFGYIRLRFNHAYQTATLGDKYNSMQEALGTIELCREKETNYYLPHLLILVGNGGAGLMSREERLRYFREAKALCQIYRHSQLLLKIEKHMAELEDEN